MDIRTLLATCALGFLSASFARSQDITFSEVGPVNIGTAFSLHSEVLSEERKIFVSLPVDYETSEKRYPVVYILDAQNFSQYQYAYGEVNALATLAEIPEVILVGVVSDDRRLDMTVQSPTNEGRADEFINFFRDELQVFINAQFRTEPYTILIGHSLGGSFALYTLVQEPDTFNAYIALSPALQFDDGRIFLALKDQLASGIDFDNALFTSLADEDGDMQQYYEDFLKLLAETMPPGLDFKQMAFPDEDHGSTTMPGVHHGILSMYANWVPPDTIDSLEALVTYYRNLSEHYGYPIPISKFKASNLGGDFLARGDATSALEVFEFSLANLAQGPVEYHQMGLALRELDRFDEALAAFENAIERGRDSPFYDMFIRDRDDVVQELSE